MALSEDTLVKILLQEQPRLLAFLHAIVRRAELADDLFQEVSLRAVRARATLENEEHFIHWLYRAARHRAIDELRRSRLPSIDNRVLDLLESGWANDPVARFGEQSEALRQCLERQKPEARRLIRLRYSDGLSGKAIAEKFKQTPQSVYMRLSRVRQRLRACVESRLGQGQAKEARDGLA